MKWLVLLLIIILNVLIGGLSVIPSAWQQFEPHIEVPTNHYQQLERTQNDD